MPTGSPRLRRHSLLQQDHPTHGELNFSSQRPTLFNRLDQRNNSQVSAISRQKTQLGFSSTSYSHCDLFPIYGSGQGSGNSPGLWCAISSILFDVYEQQACGTSFYSPDKTIAVKLYMIGFVDNTCGSTNDFLLTEPAPLLQYANLRLKPSDGNEKREKRNRAGQLPGPGKQKQEPGKREGVQG